MAISSSYYINAPSLGSATAVFTDSSLLTCAADGFYSDGVISREQVGCVLLPQQTCPSCATPCGTSILANGAQGIYLLEINTGGTGSDVGAVIVRFNPQGIPDGIRATLGANVYNKLTSATDGLHESTNAGAFTFVGAIGADCGISGTTYPALTEYLYDSVINDFVATGNTQSVTVAPGDVSLGSFGPGNCLMVIPKLIPSPSIINFEVAGPCSTTLWEMSVACPVLLTGFSSSVMSVSSIGACSLSETVTYYNASLASTPGTVGLYDFVYSDAYGSTQLPAGFYLATGSITGGNDWFEVDANGVVIDLGSCSAVTAILAFDFYNDGSGNIRARATVTSGTTLDILTFTGSVNGYQSIGCSGTLIVQPSLSVPLPAGSLGGSLQVFPSASAIVSAQYDPLIVNGNTITMPYQNITVGGNTYTITGATNCYSPL